MSRKPAPPSPSPFSSRFRQLTERLWLRFHWSLIFTATVASGVGFSGLLLRLGLRSMAWRYPLATALSYGFFFVLVRLWLAYVRDSGHFRAMRDEELESLHGELRRSREGRSGGGWDLSGFDIPSGDDPISGTIAALMLALLLIILIFALGSWFFLEAPMILLDAAFQFALSAALLRSARRMDRPDWTMGVLRQTIVPFVLILLGVWGAGALLQIACPAADRLGACVRASGG